MKSQLSHSEIEHIIDKQEEELDSLLQEFCERDVTGNQSGSKDRANPSGPIKYISFLWGLIIDRLKNPSKWIDHSKRL